MTHQPNTDPADLAAQTAAENAAYVRRNHDRGLAFDLATMNRRQVLGLTGGAALVAAGGLITGANADTDTVIPSETAGPYPADGSNGVDVRVEDGIVRSDITSSFGDYSGTAEGIPVTIELDLWDLDADAALADAAVYLWHCTADGEYSLYSQSVLEENFLRGIQESDENGHVAFTSIFPGCYAGRWPHIHFEVYASVDDATSGSGTPMKTSQIAIPQEAGEAVYSESGYGSSTSNLEGISLSTDNVFGDDEGESQLATATGSVSEGYTLTLEVGISPSTEEETSDMGSAGPGGMGQPPAGAPGSQSSGTSTSQSSGSSGSSSSSSTESTLGTGAPSTGGGSSSGRDSTDTALVGTGGALAALAGWLGIRHTRSRRPAGATFGAPHTPGGQDDTPERRRVRSTQDPDDLR
ncbi:peptidase associated/transthyretin-like domain-containing protein [Kytococcus sp. Marseille-QA3725]